MTVSGNIFSGVLISTDLTVNKLASLLANSQNLVEAVVVVDDLLDSKGHRGDLLGECRHTNLTNKTQNMNKNLNRN